MTGKQQEGRHVASERAEHRGQAHTAQPDKALTREDLLATVAQAVNEPSFLDALAEEIAAKVGKTPTAEEIAQAIEDVRSTKAGTARKGGGQAGNDDDKRTSRG